MRRRLTPEEVLERTQRLVANELPLEDASDRSAGLMSADDKRKLDSIDQGANKTYAKHEINEIVDELKVRLRGLEQSAAHVDHVHDLRYPLRQEVQKAVERKIDRDDFRSMFNRALDERDDIDAAKLGGKDADEYVLKSALTFTAFRDLFASFKQPLGDAATLEGASLRDLHKTFQPRREALVSETAPAYFKAGHRMEAASGGIVKYGKVFCPDPQKSNLWKYRNNGAHTFRAPVATGDYEIKVIIAHDSLCGAISFTEFTSVFGDNIDRFGELHPIAGEVYLVKVTRIAPYVIAEIIRVQKTADLLMGG